MVAGQVFGLFAGIATILYVAGGIVVGLRLWYRDLPVWAVVNQLPRELLVTEALVYIAAPFGVFVLGYVGVTPIVRRRRERRFGAGALRHHYFERRLRINLVYLVGGVSVVAVAAVLITARGQIFAPGVGFVTILRLLGIVSILGLLTAILSGVSVGSIRRRWLEE